MRKKANRENVQDNRATRRANMGKKQVSEDQAVYAQDYNLSWFKPTETQKEIIYSMCTNPLTIVNGSSGSGKSTTAIWQGLNDLRRGVYKKVLFIKTPDESGDDKIGYLPSDATSKISVHMEAMRSIFWSFMTKQKLEMEEKREKIEFTIPNFIKGKTFDNTLILVDECQSMSPKTLKLIMERCGEGSTITLMGDKFQCYSADRRKDGFSYFITLVTEIENGERVSKEPLMGYVRLTAADNMRSDISQRVVELYEENSDL